MNQETKQWLDMADMDLGVAKYLMENSFLLNQVKNFVMIEEKYYDYADTRTPYGVAVRYPNELFLEEHHAKEAIQYADEIMQWVYELVEDEAADK